MLDKKKSNTENVQFNNIVIGAWSYCMSNDDKMFTLHTHDLMYWIKRPNTKIVQFSNIEIGTWPYCMSNVNMFTLHTTDLMC